MIGLWFWGRPGTGTRALETLLRAGRVDLFDAVWLIGWSAGIVIGAGLLLRALIGRDVISFSPRGIELRSRIGPLSRGRLYEYETLRGIHRGEGRIGFETHEGRVYLTNLGTDADREWLYEVLCRSLGQTPQPPSAPVHLQAQAPPKTPPPVPKGWVVSRDETGGYVVRTAPGGRWAGIGCFTCVCLFWNGIVGVFVAGGLGFIPQDKIEAPAPVGSLFYWLFVSPFILIGLVILWGVLYAIFVTVERRVSPNCLEVVTRYLGRTKRESLGPGHFAIERDTDHENSTSYKLVLISSSERHTLESGSASPVQELGRLLSYHTGWDLLEP